MSKHNIAKVRQRYTNISDEELRDVVAGINLENPNSGSEEVTAILRTRHPQIITQRNRVRAALREADPVGTASRWSRVIQRRRYSVPSPNAVWHLDTNHALRRWRFVVRVGIDGFSRLVTFPRASSNNRAKTSFVCC
ncbi:uncharacterized protein LOC128546705 [Mercenaria mercenaria]|uniref:uncharacterized protein LOC128546705 n=1 Tax=Mercenaria mercenaria TaxID=6596 RepID=UPI00234EF7DC|nr:uncharacterized protein LOC128546705 [Mercenaria mercenaria]